MAEFGQPRGPERRDIEARYGETEAPVAVYEKQAEAAGLRGASKQQFVEDKMTSWEEKSATKARQEELGQLEIESRRQAIEAGRKPEASKLQKRKGELAVALEEGIITQSQYDDLLVREIRGDPPRGYDSWAQYENKTGIDADGDGKVGGEKAAQPPTTDKRARLEELRRKKAGK